MSQYDVVIIGGGPGGYNAAIRAGQLGLKAAIIEMRETLGGTCLNVGCMPSKALLHASELYEAANREFEHLGIEVSPRLNLTQMMAQKDESVSALTKGVDFLMKKNKVERILGKGRLAGPGRVEVDGADGKTVTLEARNIVIATGSEPSGLPGVAVDGERIVDSTGALSLAEVPKTMIVIGAGIIGLELGSVWRRLGAEVTVIEYLDRICPGMDAEVAKTFQRILTKQGVNFRLGSKVTGAKAGKSRVDLTVEPAAGGGAETLSADRVLLAIGRRPYTAGLGLETVGIVPDARGFIETDHFRTSAAGVWAVGDVIHGPMLAHKAEEDGIAVAEWIAGKHGHVNWDLMPAIVYTDPELASVGLGEDAAKAKGLAINVGKFNFAANARALANDAGDGYVKIIADAKTDKIIGAQILGKNAGELISEIVTHMEYGGSAEDLARTVHAHPTMSEAVKEAAMAVNKSAIHAI